MIQSLPFVHARPPELSDTRSHWVNALELACLVIGLRNGEQDRQDTSVAIIPRKDVLSEVTDLRHQTMSFLVFYFLV